MQAERRRRQPTSRRPHYRYRLQRGVPVEARDTLEMDEERVSWLAVDALPLSMAKRERADRRKRLRSKTADLREVIDKILAPAARLQDAIETLSPAA
jgi:hypothetical protein